MSFPLLSEKWQEHASVSKDIFSNAYSLFKNEKYAEAKDLLDEFIGSSIQVIGAERTSGDELLGLYANILFFLKDFDQLNSFFPQWDVLEDFPMVQLVRIKLLNIEGRHKEAFSLCSSFIEGNKPDLSEHLPDYLNYRGHIHFKLGNINDALEDIENSFAFFRFQKRSFEMGMAANRQGIIHFRLAQYSETVKCFEKALSSFKKQNIQRKQSMVLLNLGIAFYKMGDLQASSESLKKSHEIAVSGNWIHRQLFTNIAIANVYRIKRSFGVARKMLHTAYSQAQFLGYLREEALALEFLGDIFRDENNPNEAKRYYARAFAIGSKIAPSGDIVMEIHRRLGECHLANGDTGSAVAELRKSISLAQTQGDRFEEAVAFRVMAQAKMLISDFQSAEEFISDSVAILTEIGARFELGLSRVAWVEIKHSQIHHQNSAIPVRLLLAQAWDHASKALDCFKDSGSEFYSKTCRNEIERIGKLRHQEERNQEQNSTRVKNSVTPNFANFWLCSHS